MKFFSDINFSKLSFFDSILAAFQLIRKDFSKDFVLLELKNKLKEAKLCLSSIKKPDNKLKKLLDLFYKTWHFGGAQGVYKLSDALWIDNVLKTYQGTAVSLGIIFLYIAQALKLPIYPVIFPTQLILCADWINQQKIFINPINGDIVDRHILEVWLKGNISPTAELHEDNLCKAESIILIQKMLETLKSALMEEKQIELALNVSNVLIHLDPKNPYEIRDRGLIYAQLECNHIALRDLMYFVEHCPDDPISEIIKVQIYAIEKKKMVLH